MHWKRALLLSWLASPLGLAITDAQAQSQCRAGHAVDLTIELEPPELEAHQRLRQRLTAELRARDLDVCAPGPGERSLAQVRVSAPLPALSPTSVTIRTTGGTALQRNLDVAALPLEARPSAIASATDELLSSLLQAPSALAASGDDSTAQARATDETAPPAREPVWKVPRLELGLGGGGALFAREGKAYRGELLARWRPLSRLSTTLRLGGDHQRTGETPSSMTPTGLRVVDRSAGGHAGLDVGFDLSEPREGFGLTAVAGLALARLQLSQRWPMGSLVRQFNGSSWEAAANLGGELNYRAEGWGVDLALSLLVPFTPRERNWQSWEDGGAQLAERTGNYAPVGVVPPGPGLGEQLGGQLDLRLWLALDS
jgi:hypothetical protein